MAAALCGSALAKPPVIVGAAGFLSGKFSTPKKSRSPLVQISTSPTRMPMQLGRTVTYSTGDLSAFVGTASSAALNVIARVWASVRVLFDAGWPLAFAHALLPPSSLIGAAV